jgi:hypothetical protein
MQILQCEYGLSDSKKKNRRIKRELHAPQVTEFIEQCRGNWKEEFEKMSSDGISKNILTYQPKMKRSIGKTCERIFSYNVRHRS